MSLGKVIRKYRKIRNMTQEEMAGRLGVSAPAVNKWENENSFPDITLLAPIARLLDISLDTLLSFHKELTQEEINEIVREAYGKMKEGSFDEAFRWAKKKLEQYPNCQKLSLNLAAILDAQRIVQGISDDERVEDYIASLYIDVLNSNEEALRIQAADCLVGFYMRKGQYDKAETYLKYFSAQDPEKKRKQAQIYSETGRKREAYQAYEELLFSDYQRASLELYGMYMLALQDHDMERARRFAAKQEELARCFEMGKYCELFCWLEIATREQDADAVTAIMEEMLLNVEQIGAFRNASLYEHMEFQDLKSDFLAGLKENLITCFRDEGTYGFLKDNKRWQELVKDKGLS